MTINSREKGKRIERAAAKALSEMGFKCRRGVQYQGGPGSADVVGIPGVHLEIKGTERFQLHKSLEQSKAEAGEGEVPLVLLKQNGKPWVVICELDRLIDLAEKIHRREPEQHPLIHEEYMKDLRSLME